MVSEDHDLPGSYRHKGFRTIAANVIFIRKGYLLRVSLLQTVMRNKGYGIGASFASVNCRLTRAEKIGAAMWSKIQGRAAQKGKSEGSIEAAIELIPKSAPWTTK